MKYKTVDKLAELNAKIADLSEKAEKLKEQLKQRGVGEYAGSEFAATVSEFDRLTLDPDKVKRYLTPAQLRRATVKTKCVSLRLKPIES